MAILRVEGFPDDLLRDLRVKAAQEDTTIKKLMIAAAERLVGRKVAAKNE
jgi:plasmid stability protein